MPSRKQKPLQAFQREILIQATGYNFVEKGGGAEQEGAVAGDKYLQKLPSPLGCRNQKGNGVATASEMPEMHDVVSVF